MGGKATFKTILHNVWLEQEMWFSLVTDFNEEDNMYDSKKESLKV